MKKFLIFIFLLVATLGVGLGGNNISFAAEYNLGVGQAVVIASRCDCYASASFDEKLTEGESTVSLKLGDKVDVNAIEGNFAKITIGEKEAYVYKFYLTQNTSQYVYPVFNASIRRKTPILDMDFKKSGFVAKKGSRVYLYDGFKDSKYTPVQVVLEDGSLHNGYISTADINPDGVSALLIVGISLIVASVTIILSLVFIKKKKNGSKT